MDSDDDFIYEEADSDEISDEEEELPMEMGPAESSSTHERRDDEDFQFEVLTADQIVQFMVDSIKEVNAVVQVCMMCCQCLTWFFNVYVRSVLCIPRAVTDSDSNFQTKAYVLRQ